MGVEVGSVSLWVLAKRALLAFATAFVVYFLMLFVVGLASIGHMFPADPVVKLIILCLGVNGVAAFCGVLAGTARLFEHRRKVTVVVGAVVFAFDLGGQIIRAFNGSLSLSGWSDDVWFSLAWYVGVLVAMGLRMYRPPMLVERV